MKTAVLIIGALAIDLLYCLLLAIPLMLLTKLLHDQGWPITPLGYWASYWAAFLLSWFIDGAGTTRRVLQS